MKEPECDVEARRLLQIQTGRDTTAAKAADTVLIALFCAMIAVTAVLIWLLPDRDFSENENRTLSQMPEISVSSVFSGEFMADFPGYLADQFPARDFFVTLKAAAETALGKRANNGVILARGGTLIPREDEPNTANLAVNLHAIGAFSAYCARRGIPMTTAVAGRKADVLDDRLPAFYGSASSDKLWQTIADAADAEGLTILDLRTPLRERAQAGEYVYYRTDHHWTTLGAYYGASAILEAMGKTPSPLDFYTRECVSNAFYGTTWSTAGMSWVKPDTMEFFRYQGDEDFTTTIADDGSSFPGFYDRTYLDKKDKYSAFLSNNHALVTVQKNGEPDRETLLVIKDSFAHSAAPFLAEQFDLVIVDVRYYHKSVAALLDEYSVSRVLLLYNAASLTDSAASRMLEAGLKE